MDSENLTNAMDQEEDLLDITDNSQESIQPVTQVNEVNNQERIPRTNETRLQRIRDIVLTKGEKWLNELNNRAESFQPHYSP